MGQYGLTEEEVWKKEEKVWKKKADDMWRKTILQVGRCEMCLSANKQLHSHHIISRNHLSYRHLLENGVCLCAYCHVLGNHSAHKNRKYFLEWLETNRVGQWQWLMEHTVEKPTEIGKIIYIDYHPIRIEHLGDEKEYKELKTIYEAKK